MSLESCLTPAVVVGAKLDNLERRFDCLERRFDALNRRIDRHQESHP